MTYIPCPTCGEKPLIEDYTGIIRMWVCPQGHRFSRERIELLGWQIKTNELFPAGAFQIPPKRKSK